MFCDFIMLNYVSERKIVSLESWNINRVTGVNYRDLLSDQAEKVRGSGQANDVQWPDGPDVGDRGSSPGEGGGASV